VVRRQPFKKAADGKNELPECEPCQILIFDYRFKILGMQGLYPEKIQEAEGKWGDRGNRDVGALLTYCVARQHPFEFSGVNGVVAVVENTVAMSFKHVGKVVHRRLVYGAGQ
jgi:hypothetical protein